MSRSSLFRFSFIVGLLAALGPAKAEFCENQDFTRQIDFIISEAKRVNAFSGRPKVHVVKSNELNALAIKDGHIIFSTGIIAAFENDAEFYSILFHEIAHHALGHLKEQKQSTPLEALLGSGLGDIVGFYQQGQMSQQQESEADLFAAKVLGRLGYDPSVILKALSKIDSDQPSLLDTLFGSHPLGQARMSFLKERMSSIVRAQTGLISRPWPRFPWRCKD